MAQILSPATLPPKLSTFFERLDKFIQEPQDFLSKIDESPENRLVFLLNESVLEGEYYTIKYEYKAYYELLITSLETKANEIKDIADGVLAEQSLSIDDYLLNLWLGSVLKAMSAYKVFIEIVRRYLEDYKRVDFWQFELESISKYQSYAILLEKIKDSETDFLGNDDDDILYDRLLLLFYINLYLAELDLHLDCSHHTTQQLHDLIVLLGSDIMRPNYLEPYRDILLDKAKYLIYKIALRIDPSERRIGDKPNQTAKEILRLIGSKNQTFAGFKKQTDLHYKSPKDIKNDTIEYFQNRLKTSGTGEINIRDIHFLNRAYKYKNDLAGLERLKKEIEAQPHKNKEVAFFDGVAVHSAINLVQNTVWKLEWEKDKSDDYASTIANFQLKNEYFTKIDGDIKKHCSDFKTYDYHGYEKYLEHIEDFISYVRLKPEALLSDDLNKKLKEGTLKSDDIIPILDKITILKDLYFANLQIFDKHLRRCKHRTQKPVELKHHECFCEYSYGDDTPQKKLMLFLDSSYILPDNYEYLEQKWYGKKGLMETNFRSLKNRLEVEYKLLASNKILEDAQELKKKADELTKDVKEKELKAMQSIALFVSVASLIFSNIKIFDNRNLLESLVILFGIGTLLLGFNYFIYLLYDTKEENPKVTFLKRTLITFAVITVILAVLIGYIFPLNITQKTHQQETETVITPKDTVITQKLYEKIDSTLKK